MSTDDSSTFQERRCADLGGLVTVSSPHSRALTYQCQGSYIGDMADRWFLSLYINSMPLIFAFRVVDCVMAMGVKVIFQIGLGECGNVGIGCG